MEAKLLTMLSLLLVAGQLTGEQNQFFKAIHSTMLVSRCNHASSAYLSQSMAHSEERNWCIYWACAQRFEVTCTYVARSLIMTMTCLKDYFPTPSHYAVLWSILFVSQKFTLDFYCAHTELRMQYNTTCSSGNSCDVWVLTCKWKLPLFRCAALPKLLVQTFSHFRQQ